MLETAKVKEVERLLREGDFSQRKIAALVGVSRAIVGSIAAGTRPDYEAIRRERTDELGENLGPIERCPSCGARVYMPCRLCKVRVLKHAEQAVVRAARRRQQAAALRELLIVLRDPPPRRPDSRWPPARRLAG